MKKIAIPAIRITSEDYSVLVALKSSVETITGQTGSKITKLGEQAELSDVIVKLNQLIDRLQA